MDHTGAIKYKRGVGLFHANPPRIECSGTPSHWRRGVHSTDGLKMLGCYELKHARVPIGRQYYLEFHLNFTGSESQTALCPKISVPRMDCCTSFPLMQRRLPSANSFLIPDVYRCH